MVSYNILPILKGAKVRVFLNKEDYRSSVEKRIDWKKIKKLRRKIRDLTKESSESPTLKDYVRGQHNANSIYTNC
jgi:hypothetical protein